MFHIYAIYCKANDKVYIGQTKVGEDRFRQHRYMLNKGNHPSRHLRNAWSSYGSSAFEFFLLDERQTKEEINTAEQEYISWYQSQGLSFNVLKGGEGPEQFSTETREKIRQATLGKPTTEAQRAALEAGRDRTGWKPSEEVRAKMSAAKHGWKPTPEMNEAARQRNLGKPMSEENKRKLSEANKGNSNFRGKHHSEESKQRLSEKRKGAGNPAYGTHHSAEHKAKQSAALKGRPGRVQSEETKQKLREARKLQVMKPMSQETKNKIATKANERAALRKASS